MPQPTDVPILAAIVTASASIVAAALTHLVKLFSDLGERRRHRLMHLMTIRNELVVNGTLAKAVMVDTCTFGIRFVEKAWATSDTSVIYRHGVPSSSILEAYSAIQLFNTLNDRYVLISAKEDYGPNKESRLAKRARRDGHSCGDDRRPDHPGIERHEDVAVAQECRTAGWSGPPCAGRSA